VILLAVPPDETARVTPALTVSPLIVAPESTPIVPPLWTFSIPVTLPPA
jgi:hypothetical protein